MEDRLEKFVERVPNFLDLSPSGKIDYFLYFLTMELGREYASPADIKACFSVLKLVPYSNTPQYFSLNSLRKTKKPPKYLKTKDGYCLVREKIVAIKSEVDKNPLKIKTHEAIRCFEVSAYRASIIMTWNLAIDHLFNYILHHKLNDFDIVLSKNTDKRVKVTKIVCKDDFSDIPENKFIDFCRTAHIISNDVRKILDVKLGIRNTCGHPSNVLISESKAVEYIEDLVVNVVLKFKI
jgi:hypothetical protein